MLYRNTGDKIGSERLTNGKSQKVKKGNRGKSRVGGYQTQRETTRANLATGGRRGGWFLVLNSETIKHQASLCVQEVSSLEVILV